MTEAKMAEKKTEAPKPDKKFRSGRVVATVWSNQRKFDGKDIKTHSVNVVKSYKDEKSGEWKDTNSYNRNDLSDLRTVADEAFKFLALKESEDAE
jgi:hypothetical protein